MAQTITGINGYESDVDFGSDGAVVTGQYIRGNAGAEAQAEGGTTGAVLGYSARAARVFIDGVDRSEYVRVGIRRALTLSGGSKAVCDIVIINDGDLPPFRPEYGSDIVIWERTSKFFAGIIDTIDEFSYGGGNALVDFSCRCVDYGALCDRRIIGWHFEVWAGALASILMGQIAMKCLADLGVVYAGGSGYDNVNLGVQNFNYITVTEAYNQIANAVNGIWYIDFDKNLWLVGKGTSGSAIIGALAAPFDIADNDGNWAQMHVVTSGPRKVNRQGVRNSQDLDPLWTDTFVGDGAQRTFPTMAALSAAPIVKLDGVVQVVIPNPLTGPPTGDWDVMWQEYTVFFNAAKSAPPFGAVVQVQYPSPLSHVEWVEDEADIALYGRFEAVDEIKDAVDIAAMQAAAAGLLAERKVPPRKITYTTWRPGLTTGMTQTLGTTRPLTNEVILIQQLTSEELGKGEKFQHTVTGSTARFLDESGIWARLLNAKRQPKDRNEFHVNFELAGTYEGVTNPGLTVGVKTPIGIAPKDGVCVEATVLFNSADTPTTTDIIIDIYKNGVSIFGATKLVYPAGATTVQKQITFASSPLTVKKDDVFTIAVTAADTNAHDGLAILTVRG